MAKEYVPIFFDWLDETQGLSAEEKGNLIDAVVAYASGNDYEQYLTGAVRIAFPFMKGKVDRNNKISEARSVAGSNKPEQTETNGNKPEQTETNTPKEKEKEKDKEKEKNKESNRRFTPPSVEEVTAYCRERNNGVDPQVFVDFYAGKGWKVGNSPMKDWRACVRTWEKRCKTPFAPTNTKRVSAQDYEQRDYNEIRNTLEDAQRRRFEERLAAMRNE